MTDEALEANKYDDEIPIQFFGYKYSVCWLIPQFLKDFETFRKEKSKQSKGKRLVVAIKEADTYLNKQRKNQSDKKKESPFVEESEDDETDSGTDEEESNNGKNHKNHKGLKNGKKRSNIKSESEDEDSFNENSKQIKHLKKSNTQVSNTSKQNKIKGDSEIIKKSNTNHQVDKKSPTTLPESSMASMISIISNEGNDTPNPHDDKQTSSSTNNNNSKTSKHINMDENTRIERKLLRYRFRFQEFMKKARESIDKKEIVDSEQYNSACEYLSSLEEFQCNYEHLKNTKVINQLKILSRLQGLGDDKLNFTKRCKLLFFKYKNNAIQNNNEDNKDKK